MTVQVEVAGARSYGTLYELSLGGAFIELGRFPPVGTSILVHAIALGTQMALAAEVRYVTRGGEGPRGLGGAGVAWRELEPAQRLFLQTLVERVQAGLSLRGD